jgi:hypothetical protein
MQTSPNLPQRLEDRKAQKLMERKRPTNTPIQTDRVRAEMRVWIIRRT